MNEKEIVDINLEDIIGEGSGMEFEIVEPKKKKENEAETEKIVDATDNKN